MDLQFTPDQELWRDSVRRFLGDHAPIAYVRACLDDERGITDEVWAGLGALGVTGVLVPEQYGGAGGGMVDAAVVLEELGRQVHPGPFAASAIGAASLVQLAGTQADAATFLPGLASGELIGAVAFLDDATASTAGDGWAVTGHARRVPDANAAHILVVTASEPGGTTGVFVVERDAPGLDVASAPGVDGTRKHGSVSLVDVPARRLGSGDGKAAIGETVDRLTIAAVVDGVGTASRALEMAVDYAKERRQFDRPVGSFQAVQHLCVDMLRAVELARAGAYYACWAADAADAAERHRAATMAHAFAADELYQVGTALVQVHGGIGFTWEHDAHLYFKRLMTLRGLGGGPIAQLEELASIVLDAGDAPAGSRQRA